MKIEKNRHLIILHTLANTDEAVTSDVLANLSLSSLRTIKNDINYLNNNLIKEGIGKIESYKAKGYRLKAIDEDKYNEFYRSITVLYTLFHNRSIESTNRRIYILKRLLVSDNVKIEDIADELFLSRSSLRNDMAWSIRFLESYHLALDTEIGKGYVVKGKEQDVRSALVELHTSQYHEFEPLYPYEPIDKLFLYEGKNYYQELRRAFLDVLRSSRIVISDIAAKKVATHICLMKNRINDGKYVDIDKEMADEIRETYDYEIAKEIFKHPVISSYVMPDDIEVVNLARLLLINRDLDFRVKGIEDLPINLVNDNLRIFNELLEMTKNSLGAKMHNTDFFKIYSRDFESLQMQLYLKHRFDYTSKMRFVTYIEGDEDLFSPIPFELTRAMIARLQVKFGSVIRDPVVMSYAAVYERLLKKVTYPYKKKRLAVTSAEGLVYSQHLSENIGERYSRYIEKLDVYNLYEMRKVNFDDYDAIVHCGMVLYYAYPLPVVDMRELDYYKQGANFFESVFKDGYDRKEINTIKSIMNIHTGTNISSINSFVEALSYRYGVSVEAQQSLYNQYINNEQIIEHYYSRNNIIMVFMPYIWTLKNIIDIYVPSQSFNKEEGKQIKAVIAVSVDTEKSLAELKILDHVLRYIVQVPDTINNLCIDKDNTLESIFNHIIERSFFGI